MSQVRKPRTFATTAAMWKAVQEAAARGGTSASSIVNLALEAFFTTKIDRGDWDTTSDDEWYDPRQFYTASDDRKGHDRQVRFNIPKNIAALVGRVVGSGAIPEYRSPQDFYRDAFVHRATQVARWIDDGELAREVGLMALLAEEDYIAQQRTDAETLIKHMRANFEDAYRRGDYAWITAHAKEKYEALSSIPEAFQGDYTKLLDEFIERGRTAGKGLRVIEGGGEEATEPKRRGRPPKEAQG